MVIFGFILSPRLGLYLGIYAANFETLIYNSITVFIMGLYFFAILKKQE